MLPEISLNILDIAQNSVSAQASLITITVETVTDRHLLNVTIEDNGTGMSGQMVQSVTDPFFTTRKTRNVGLGVPFLKQEAECTGGSFSIQSVPGRGTVVTSTFCTDHIDCMPLGDINSSILSLVTMNADVDFCYRRIADGCSFELDTRNMREILGDIPLNSPEVSDFLRRYLEENEAETTG